MGRSLLVATRTVHVVPSAPVVRRVVRRLRVLAMLVVCILATFEPLQLLPTFDTAYGFSPPFSCLLSGYLVLCPAGLAEHEGLTVARVPTPDPSHGMHVSFASPRRYLPDLLCPVNDDSLRYLSQDRMRSEEHTSELQSQ